MPGGTFQDRLVIELRLARAADIEAANRLLARFVPRFNRRFAVPPANPEPAWRPLSADVGLDQVCCLKYRPVVAHDNTVRAGATILQLPARSGGRTNAGRRVELQLRLDGRLVVWMANRPSSSRRRRPIRSNSGPSSMLERISTQPRPALAPWHSRAILTPGSA